MKYLSIWATMSDYWMLKLIVQGLARTTLLGIQKLIVITHDEKTALSNYWQSERV